MPLQIHSLQPAVQHYDWGGFEFIPHLLGRSNDARQPFAELWLGDHQRGAARIAVDGRPQALADWLAEAPRERLGESVLRNFGSRLPFLFKVLDVRLMLSIQAHPDREQAHTGFQRENEQGIPLDAPHRNFKDTNHKPEVMVALTDFWLLHGFRSIAAIRQMLEATPEFALLRPLLPENDIQSFYAYLMNLPQAEVDRLLHPLRHRLHSNPPHDKSSPDFWADRAFRTFDTPEGHSDRGIFSIYLFNLVYVPPGQGIYQAAGIPHAYLEGVNVELMASSDNVFRGGLTSKHIDVPALLAHLDFDAVTPRLLSGEPVSACERRFLTPAPDFELSRIELDERCPTYRHTSLGPEILLFLRGQVRADQVLELGRGSCLFVPHGVTYSLESPEGALAFKASLPAAQN